MHPMASCAEASAANKELFLWRSVWVKIQNFVRASLAHCRLHFRLPAFCRTRSHPRQPLNPAFQQQQSVHSPNIKKFSCQTLGLRKGELSQEYDAFRNHRRIKWQEEVDLTCGEIRVTTWLSTSVKNLSGYSSLRMAAQSYGMRGSEAAHENELRSLVPKAVTVGG